jgi:hypothetical protein
MTAVEWDTSTDPEAMLSALDDARFSTARLPVVLAGFAERGRLPGLLSPDLQPQFLGYARWVFGLAPRPLPIELLMASRESQEIDIWDADIGVRMAVGGESLNWVELMLVSLAEVYGTRRVAHNFRPPVRDAELWQHRQADALRDALGNPLAPVTWEPSWRSETVVALATGIHLDNAFDRLPILADALEEAGCDDPEVLAHCRGPGPHARGCWVVDAARGR